MLWVKTLPCFVLVERRPLHTAANVHAQCGGVVEADHGTSGALSNKAHDGTCIPLCTKHHRERTDHVGYFRGMKRHDMRAFLAAAREYVEREARRQGVVMPTMGDASRT